MDTIKIISATLFNRFSVAVLLIAELKQHYKESAVSEYADGTVVSLIKMLTGNLHNHDSHRPQVGSDDKSWAKKEENAKLLILQLTSLPSSSIAAMTGTVIDMYAARASSVDTFLTCTTAGNLDRYSSSYSPKPYRRLLARSCPFL